MYFVLDVMAFSGDSRLFLKGTVDSLQWDRIEACQTSSD